ncbi:MAG: hypothetical protein ACKVQK_01580 [Burkholderiales bacterium]
MAGLWVQDSGCQESIGAIADCTQEHLCSADAALARVRRVLAAAIEAQQVKGTPHGSAGDPSAYRQRSVGMLLPKGTDWIEGTAKHVIAHGPITYAIPGNEAA